MTRQQERHKLVSQVAVAERFARLVCRCQQLAEDVLVTLTSTVAASLGYEAQKKIVKLPDAALKAAPRGERSEVDSKGGEQPHYLACGDVEHWLEGGSQSALESGVPNPEHRSHDHLEGDALHRRTERENAIVRPGCDLPPSGLADDRAERAQGIAVEGRSEHTALPQVLLAIEKEDGLRTGDRLKNLVGNTGVCLLTITTEKLGDGIGVSHVDDRAELLAGSHERECENVTETALAARYEEIGPLEKQGCLDKPGTFGPGGIVGFMGRIYTYV